MSLRDCSIYLTLRRVDATINWDPVPGAEFYIVKLGTRPDLMIQNYQVYDDNTSFQVRGLNIGTKYYVSIDAVNENGVDNAIKPTELE